jgi:hypothetical protein
MISTILDTMRLRVARYCDGERGSEGGRERTNVMVRVRVRVFLASLPSASSAECAIASRLWERERSCAATTLVK